MFPLVEENRCNAVIKVFGLGGGGGNAINTMIEEGLPGVEFIAANTDAQARSKTLAPLKIRRGAKLTKGLGAGANPDTGRQAALEDRDILSEALMGADMVFMNAGLGGGAGAGGGPVVAEVRRELVRGGSVGMSERVTKPGYINLDFADVKTIMSGSGVALMGTGSAAGQNRAMAAAEKAISRPLLEDVALRGARGGAGNTAPPAARPRGGGGKGASRSRCPRSRSRKKTWRSSTSPRSFAGGPPAHDVGDPPASRGDPVPRGRGGPQGGGGGGPGGPRSPEPGRGGDVEPWVPLGLRPVQRPGGRRMREGLPARGAREAYPPSRRRPVPATGDAPFHPGEQPAPLRPRCRRLLPLLRDRSVETSSSSCRGRSSPFPGRPGFPGRRNASLASGTAAGPGGGGRGRLVPPTRGGRV